MLLTKVPWDSRWREIPNFPNYYLSQYGQVFNLKRMHLMSLHYNQRDILCVRMYQKSAMGSRGMSRSIPKLLREVFPKEQVLSELVPILTKTEIVPNTLRDVIAEMRKVIGEQPNGEYHFPGLRFTDHNPDVVLLHTLVSRIGVYFPEYTWATISAFDPSVTGMTVRWTKKKPPVTRVIIKKEIDQ